MNKEICEYYEPRKKWFDKMCKHFTGNTKNEMNISKCKYNCSIIDCKNLMGHDSYTRHKGALKKR